MAIKYQIHQDPRRKPPLPSWKVVRTITTARGERRQTFGPYETREAAEERVRGLKLAEIYLTGAAHG